MRRNSSSEPLVVRTADLGMVIGGWLDVWRRERPASSPKMGSRRTVFGTPREFESGPAWLARESGVHERQVRAIVSGSAGEYVLLSTGDALLTAIGHPELLSDGTVPVLANPKMSPRTWAQRMRERGVDPEAVALAA